MAKQPDESGREPQHEHDEPREARESGKPGGGAGRRDETGHSGVYPASRAEGADPGAPLKGEAGWGQGERGAAGYEDSGSSELHPPVPDEEDVGEDEERAR